MIKTYEDWENSLDQNYVNQLGPDAWDLTCGAFEAGQQSQQAKIDELQKLRSLDEMAINQLAQANQVWRAKCDELQARVDSLTNINESLVAYKNQLLDDIEEKGNKDEN